MVEMALLSHHLGSFLIASVLAFNSGDEGDVSTFDSDKLVKQDNDDTAVDMSTLTFLGISEQDEGNPYFS